MRTEWMNSYIADVRNKPVNPLSPSVITGLQFHKFPSHVFLNAKERCVFVLTLSPPSSWLPQPSNDVIQRALTRHWSPLALQS